MAPPRPEVPPVTRKVRFVKPMGQAILSMTVALAIPPPSQMVSSP